MLNSNFNISLFCLFFLSNGFLELKVWWYISHERNILENFHISINSYLHCRFLYVQTYTSITGIHSHLLTVLGCRYMGNSITFSHIAPLLFLISKNHYLSITLYYFDYCDPFMFLLFFFSYLCKTNFGLCLSSSKYTLVCSWWKDSPSIPISKF